MHKNTDMVARGPSVCVIGDTHGHLQLALCVAARWQQVLGVTFETVLLCGDVGTFTDDSQLDSATRRHAKSNPCELEFLHQWSTTPQSHWLAKIFAPRAQDGLGLECPVIMVHGNHEGFAHLVRLLTDYLPANPISVSDLPSVDSSGFIRYLPSGWKCRTPSNIVIGGVGGIQRGHRQARYHDLAYLDDVAILNLLEHDPFDLLITHQGPSSTQGDHGSSSLDSLLDAEVCRYWFHGHSMPNPDITECGPNGRTTVVPLRDVAFPMTGPRTDEPGEDCWCCVCLGDSEIIKRGRPDFWRDFRKRKWKELPNGQLVAPPLAYAV